MALRAFRELNQEPSVQDEVSDESGWPLAASKQVSYLSHQVAPGGSKNPKLANFSEHYFIIYTPQDGIYRNFYGGVVPPRSFPLKAPQSATHLATVEVGREIPVAVIAKPRRASFRLMSSL